MKSGWIWIGIITTINIPTAHAQMQEWRVNAPTLDVRSTPKPASGSLDHDPEEETQLLYGEQIALFEEENGWAKIEAVEQEEWTHEKRWQGYPGWVPVENLIPMEGPWEPNLVVTGIDVPVHSGPDPSSPEIFRVHLGTRLVSAFAASDGWSVLLLDGTKGWIEKSEAERLDLLQQLPSLELRRRILAAASQFLGASYYWGGRSTVVDCSGLVNLSYRAAGIDIPRDAHEQSMRAKAIQIKELIPGDLIFLSDPNNAQKITHVMIYAGDGQIIEAPGTGKQVRKVSLQERIQQARQEKRVVSCGRFIS